jgi:hypothetical protein
MSKFRVITYPEGGEKPPGLLREIICDQPDQAAAIVIGGKLARKGKPERLRARVWPIDDPKAKTEFYEAA